MVRDFQEKDAARCCEIVNTNWIKMTDYPVELRAYFLKKNTPEKLAQEFLEYDKAVVFETRYRIVGLGALDGAVVKGVYVDPSEHRSGIGSSIMDALEARARGRGLKALGVGSSVGAESFYAARGYRVMKRCTVEVQGMQMPSIEMEKEL